MKITEKLSYDSDVESVYGLITDQAFRVESCENQGSTDHDVTVETSGSTTTVTIVRTQPADLPDFVKKIVGSTVKVRQSEVWGPADAAGARSADVKVSILGQPAEMTGRATLSPAGDRTSFSLDGNVKVSIPFLGKKIEPEVGRAIIASLREEVEYGQTKL